MYDSLKSLKQKCLNCKKCKLSETRTNVVFGVGNENSDIIFIGEGPGKNEDLKGEPFVGQAGKLLDKMLFAINLDRKKDIYIANIVKCRPPNNRDPLEDEQEACINWLRNQVFFIKPKIIVCLGRIAAMRIIKKDFKVTREHGIFYKKSNILFMGTFHPAALLRNPNNKPSAFKDFLKLKEKLNLFAKDLQRF